VNVWVRVRLRAHVCVCVCVHACMRVCVTLNTYYWMLSHQCTCLILTHTQLCSTMTGALQGRQAVPHQISERIGVVETGVAGGRDDIVQVIGGQAEVGDVLKAAISVLDVHSVVLSTPERPLPLLRQVVSLLK
jgi:hypothetical protein